MIEPIHGSSNIYILTAAGNERLRKEIAKMSEHLKELDEESKRLDAMEEWLKQTDYSAYRAYIMGVSANEDL